MLAKLIQGLRGRTASQAGRSGAPEWTASTASATARVLRPSVPSAPGPPAKGTERAEGALPQPRVNILVQRKLRMAAASLREGFSRSGRYPDVTSILDGVTQPGAVIRQPPRAAQAVLSLLQRRNYGLNEVTALIERDPALSQSLLRHSNSVFYAGLSTQPIVSIKAAIQRVGTNGIHASVMFEVLQGEISRPGGGLDRWARLVWEHLVRTAPLARSMARSFGADPEEAFTLGLLHDVGKLVLFDRIAAERSRLRRDLELPVGFVNAALGDIHEALGGLAVLEWGLDEHAAAVILAHHRREDVPSDDPMSEVVYAAERMDIALQKGVEPDLDAIWAEGCLAAPRDAAVAWLASKESAKEA